VIHAVVSDAPRERWAAGVVDVLGLLLIDLPKLWPVSGIGDASGSGDRVPQQDVPHIPKHPLHVVGVVRLVVRAAVSHVCRRLDVFHFGRVDRLRLVSASLRSLIVGFGFAGAHPFASHSFRKWFFQNGPTDDPCGERVPFGE